MLLLLYTAAANYQEGNEENRELLNRHRHIEERRFNDVFAVVQRAHQSEMMRTRF